MVYPLIMLMQTMSAGGMGGGVAAAVARALGAGHRHDAHALVLHALLIACVMGALFTTGALWGGPALYRAMGGTGDVLAAALAYSDVVFAGALSFWLLNTLASVVRGTGNMLLPAGVVIGGGVDPLSFPSADFWLGAVASSGHRRGRRGAHHLLQPRERGTARLSALWMQSGTADALRDALAGRALLGDPPCRPARFAQHHAHQSERGIFDQSRRSLWHVRSGGLWDRRTPGIFADPSRLRLRLGPRDYGWYEYRCWPPSTRAARGLGGCRTRGRGHGQYRTLAACFPQLWLGLFSTNPDVLTVGATYLRIVGPTYGCLGSDWPSTLPRREQGGCYGPSWPAAYGSSLQQVEAGLPSAGTQAAYQPFYRHRCGSYRVRHGRRRGYEG